MLYTSYIYKNAPQISLKCFFPLSEKAIGAYEARTPSVLRTFLEFPGTYTRGRSQIPRKYFAAFIRSDRKKLRTSSRPIFYPADGQYEHHRGRERDEHAQGAAVLEQHYPAEQHEAFPADALNGVWDHEGRAHRGEDVGQHGEIMEQAFAPGGP